MHPASLDAWDGPAGKPRRHPHSTPNFPSHSLQYISIAIFGAAMKVPIPAHASCPDGKSWAAGPDYRLHFTPEGAPSKLAWAGIFVAAERVNGRKDGPLWSTC